MAIPESIRKLTEAEYLALERAAEYKSEFYDGEMFAMAGGSAMHSRITTNMIVALGSKLANGSCQVFNGVQFAPSPIRPPTKPPLGSAGSLSQ